MRRVCGFDTLSAHLVRKSLSLSLSVALGVLPMALAFAREDERTSYLANNRYQDYQNQYKPEKNYSASSQLDRQIRMQNTALALRFQAPTATSLGRVDVPKATLQTPTIKFDFLGNNAPKVPNALRAMPEALTAPIKPGLLNTIGNALKAVGHVMAYPFQRIGQGIVGLIQRAFGSGNRTTTLTDSQRATLKAYNNIQPTGDGTFKATGQTVAFGRTWEEGATFKVEGDQLRLIQGTSFERTFGGMERKDGGLMPLKMAEVNGVVQPTGLDFDRLAPNTVFAIKSPMGIEGFGDLKAGEMTYQGTWKSPDGQTTGGRFKFENTLLDLNKDLAHGMDMTNPVALRQATFALQAGLMRLNSAVVEKGSGKYFVSQDESPVNIARLEKTSGELDKRSEASLRAIETTKQDIVHRTEALGAAAKELAKVTGQVGPVSIDLNAPLADLQREAQAVRGEANRIAQAVKAGDYAGLETAAKDLAHRQEALTKKSESLAEQAAAIKDLQKGFRGMELGAKALSQKTEGPAAAQESENIEASAQIAFAAAKVLVGQGAITPDQSAQLGTQITALRNQVRGVAPSATIKPEETAAPEKQGFFGRLMQKASDLKTTVANRCQETAAKAAGAATTAKALVTDAANETAAWTMAVTQSAAAKTAGAAGVARAVVADTANKAGGWTANVTRSAGQNTADYMHNYPESAKTVDDFLNEKTTNLYDAAILKYGARIKEEPIPGYEKYGMAIGEKRLNDFREDNLLILSKRVADANYSPSAIFNIRHSFRVPFGYGITQMSPRIRIDDKGSSSNTSLLFNTEPSELFMGLAKSKTVDIYIHGYNVESLKSVDMRKQFTLQLFNEGYSNVNFSVSWSGDVGNNVLSKMVFFHRAKQSADMSWQGLQELDKFVKSFNGEIKVNAVTHSLGARLLLDAASKGVKFHNVVLFVPAVNNEDISVGGKYEKAIQNIDHLTVVYSRRQEFVFGLLYRSTELNQSLGSVGPSALVHHPDFKAIDATDAWRNPYQMVIKNHGDIYEKETVQMLRRQLRLGGKR